MENPIKIATIKLLKVFGKTLLFSVLTMLIACLFVLALLLFVDKTMLLGALTEQLSTENVTYNILYYSCITLGQIVTLYFIYTVIEKRPKNALGFRTGEALQQFVIGGGWGTMLISTVFVLLWICSFIDIVQLYWDTKSLALFFVFFLLVSLVEELVFRTFFINLLQATYSPRVALVVSSLLFAIIHYTNPSYGILPFVSILLGGLVLGVLYMKTQQIWAPLGFHLMWNYFQGNVYGFQVSGLETTSLLNLEKANYPLLTGGDFGLEGSVLGILVLLICLWYYRRDFRAILYAKSAVFV